MVGGESEDQGPDRVLVLFDSGGDELGGEGAVGDGDVMGGEGGGGGLAGPGALAEGGLVTVAELVFFP